MRATRVLAIIAILGIAFSFRASANVVYDSETTNEWFSVNMSTLKAEDLKTPPWTQPHSGGEATVENKVIKLDTDLDDPLTYTAAQASEAVAIVAAEMTATVNASVPELNPTPQAALCVIGTASATNWVGLVGDGNGGTDWVTFSTPVPVAGETYSVRIEFDQRQGELRQIRYRVGNTVLGNGWYSNPQNTAAANIRSVSFSGSGDIAGLGGSNVVANAATFNGVGYTTFADALAAAQAAGTSWNNEKPIVLYKDATYTAVTGKAYFDANGRTLTISGGVYTKTGNTYDVTTYDECEAKIGSTFYATFDEAVEAAGANDVIVVNTPLTKELTVAKSYSLNPNGKLTCAALTVNAGQALTLEGVLTTTAATINGAVAGETLTVKNLTGWNVAKLALDADAVITYDAEHVLQPMSVSSVTINGLGAVRVGDVVLNAAPTSWTANGLSADKCLEVKNGQLVVASVAEITEMSESEGYDYTNGTVSVTATAKTAATATLTVVGWDGTTVKTATKDVTSGTAMTWDVADVMAGALTQGGVYTYKVDIKIGNDVVATKSGEFTAANWDDDIWFGADASKGEGQREVGGSWATEPSIENDVYVIEEDSVFIVDEAKQGQGSNRVTRVDAKVTFESLVDGDVDVPADEAISGFVATTDGWKALAKDAWVSLTGGPEPVAGKPYIVRAEVDFISNPKRVRYLVSEDDGATFIPLSNETAQWLELAGTTKSLLAKVELQGSGKVAKFEATVADKAIAVVGDKEYDTMAEALAAAKEKGKAIELLTNATIEPKEEGKYEIAPGNYHYVSGGKDSTGNRTIIVDGSGNPPVVRPTDTEMKKVTTPDGKPYKSYDSLRKFLEKNKVGGYTNDNANAESVSNALETVGTNNLQYWQDYALGIDIDTSVAPVTTPAGDTKQDAITLAIPAIDTSKYSPDYTIRYQVMKGGEAVQSEKDDDPRAILIPLEDNCTGTYTIKAVFTPTSASDQAN